MSETKYDQELPNDFIIPSEYYDKYRLIFSHYHLDKKIGRIGMNESQKNSKRPTDGRKYLAEDFDYSQVKAVIMPGKKITFKNSPQLAVKSLEVNIYSIESEDMAILHRLHTQTRVVWSKIFGLIIAERLGV